MAYNVPEGEAIWGKIIFLLGEWTSLCQVFEGGGEGHSVMWHREVWHQILLERGPKVYLAYKTSAWWMVGTDTVLTFL